MNELSSIYAKAHSFQKKEVEEAYYSSKIFRDILKEILSAKLNDLFITKKSDYDKSSWAYYQAHKNGEIQAIRELINIL